jgi:hypothetical protein
VKISWDLFGDSLQQSDESRIVFMGGAFLLRERERERERELLP